MRLTPTELDRLTIFTAAELARRRRAKGWRLTYPEALALICDEMHEAAARMTLLPPAPGKCQACATDHEPELPHNQESLYWHYWFYGQHGRWPTWDDAMAHCFDEVRDLWKQAMVKVMAERQEAK